MRQALLGNYLLSAFRTLKRDKLYAAINIIGLSIALSAVVLIALFIRDELTYEHWLPNHDRIYRVSAGGPDRMFNTGPSDLGLWVAQDFPQAKFVTRFTDSIESIHYKDSILNARITWVDPNFFEVFQLPVVLGELTGALNDPNSLVLTEKQAERLFGKDNPLGRTLLIRGITPMVVKAVIKDLPSNTHLNINILAPANAEFSPLAIQDKTPIDVFGQKLWQTFAYFLLNPESSVSTIQTGTAAMLDRHTGLVDSKKSSEIWNIYITSINDIHLSPQQPGGPDRNLSQILTVTAIGLLILLGASINFINLMTAMGMARAKEIGIRKTLGADRKGLMFQFLSETLLYVFISTLLASVIIGMLMPSFNAFLQREINFDILENMGLLAGVIFSAILIGILAGLYPSLILSSYPAGIVLQNPHQRRSASYVRQILIIIQFSILITLIIGTFVINHQMQFGISESLRQNTDPVVIVERACSDPFRSAVLAVPGVQSAACSALVLQMYNGASSSMDLLVEQDRGTELDYASVDEGYFKIYEIEVLAGRTFDRSRIMDHSPEENIWNAPELVVINETAARNMGFDSPADAIGQLVQWAHYFRLAPPQFTPAHEAEIIGVVEDFQRGTVHQGFRPAAFYMDLNQGRIMNIKIAGRLLPEALEGIDHAWETVEGQRPINRYFFDEAIENLYQDLMTQGKMLAIYAGVAVIISVLGLVGLAAFVTQRRTREIGIRKALGGERGSIIALLLWQFAKPVIWANIIAWPAAYYFMNVWLEGFARRIDLEFWMFLIPSLVGLTIAIMTVFIHTWFISGAEPAKVLRYE